MYLAAVVALSAILPVASIVIELAIRGGDPIFLAAKWFVFWAVGIRLLSAGLRQVAQPSFTAEAIFKISEPTARKLVTEIGFGNISMGLIATLTLIFPNWLVPAGLTGALYLALAGIMHAMEKHRGSKETIAMVSDFFIAAVVFGALGLYALT